MRGSDQLAVGVILVGAEVIVWKEMLGVEPSSGRADTQYLCRRLQVNRNNRSGGRVKMRTTLLCAQFAASDHCGSLSN